MTSKGWSLERFETAADLLRAAGDFLAFREAENNLPLGLAIALGKARLGQMGVYLSVVRGSAGVALVALRTPPCNLVISPATDPAALGCLVEALAPDFPGLPGVTGPTPETATFARAWTARTGASASLILHERIYQASHIVAPSPAPPGHCRLAGPADVPLLTNWLVDFQVEALADDPASVDWKAQAQGWARRSERRMYLWEKAGQVVAMAGAKAPTPNGIRIGPVYTPPVQRGHGYGSAISAAASAAEIAAGRRFCCLFTDLANPIPNAIYARIGYQIVSDVDMYRFARWAG